ncbi:oxysterol-binding protein-related protein 2A-like [Typha angustifolia]|uniref:oxysterol-binding protein-related protein 2A-like n=1 Tax=Typha angustifolia TaxID=59011 RepID=UPI003C2E0608
MRAREMHPLCCIAIDFPGFGSRSPAEPPQDEGRERALLTCAAVEGVLYKWTNYGKGWRPRWFSLRDGVLTYSKIRRRAAAAAPSGGCAVRVIGPAGAGGVGEKPVAVVHLKISSIRESNSDDKRFYIVTPSTTLHLRSDSRKDRVAWIEALASARNDSSMSGIVAFSHNEKSFSTEKLRDRMHEEGLGEALIRDCEQIMHSEFSQYQRKLKIYYEEYLSFLGIIPQQLEEDNSDVSISMREGQLQLIKHEFSTSGHGKYSEYSTTESSDDIEKQELDEVSDQDEPYFFDTKECFSDSAVICASEMEVPHGNMNDAFGTHPYDAIMNLEREHNVLPYIQRRNKLPEPVEKEKGISLWSMIKDNVGKDLTRVCLPVYFNEPLSSLQKCFEDMEYSYLLDKAYEYGKMGNSLMRILNVAAFAVSGYASSVGRICKPFNPLLGETYEADYPEKGIRFFSEKVSHHPMIMACHCEGKGWKFWGDSNLKSKFWGQSIQLDPVGVLTLKFDDGETFQWSKVTTTIYNLILGKVYCNHHGTMNIRGNRQYSCKLKFKEQSFLDRNPRQVQGFVEDIAGTKVATLIGKWDDNMCCTIIDDVSKSNGSNITHNSTLLWKRSKPPTNPTRYNLSSFAITLNELTSELQGKLPPTDSRLRPDQRYLENGEYEKANAEKLRLERRQRMSKKMQENGWKPRWFQKVDKDESFQYVGGYWEAREHKNWDGCLDIFSKSSDVPNATTPSS